MVLWVAGKKHLFESFYRANQQVVHEGPGSEWEQLLVKSDYRAV